jgi:hypothetical protein
VPEFELSVQSNRASLSLEAMLENAFPDARARPRAFTDEKRMKTAIRVDTRSPSKLYHDRRLTFARENLGILRTDVAIARRASFSW